MKIWTEKKLIEEGYEIRNAQIKGAELTMEHCGCISLDVVVEGEGWGCVFWRLQSRTRLSGGERI